MGNNIVRPLHVGISVKDMEVSLAWYEENLGFKIVSDDYIPPLKCRICFVEKDGFEIELFQHDNVKAMPEERKVPNTDLETIGTKHVAFLTDDMKALKERFVKNGVRIVSEGCMEGNAVIFVSDPDGVLVEFIQK